MKISCAPSFLEESPKIRGRSKPPLRPVAGHARASIGGGEATDGLNSSGRQLPADARKMFQIVAAKSEQVLRGIHNPCWELD
jgi:hypothetical protein